MDDDINPGQKINNFEVHLNKPIYLNAGATIALADISFPNSVSNIPEFVHDLKIHVYSSYDRDNIRLDGDHRSHFYESPSRLIDVMNERLDPSISRHMTFASETKRTGFQYFQVKYSPSPDFFHKTNSFTPPQAEIEIPDELKKALGLIENIIKVKKDANFEGPMPMFPSSIYLQKPVWIYIKLTPFRGYISIKDGMVHTAASLIDRLNANLDENLKQIVEIGNHEGRLRITKRSDSYSDKIYFEFPFELRGLFGLDQGYDIFRLTDAYPQYTCNRPPDLNALYPGIMMCYSNFVNHSIIGGEFYSVLKMIPLRKTNEEDNYISIHFEHLEFLNCNTSRLDILHFQLKRLDGSYVDFVNNKKILLNLAIRNPR